MCWKKSYIASFKSKHTIYIPFYWLHVLVCLPPLHIEKTRVQFHLTWVGFIQRRRKSRIRSQLHVFGERALTCACAYLLRMCNTWKLRVARQRIFAERSFSLLETFFNSNFYVYRMMSWFFHSNFILTRTICFKIEIFKIWGRQHFYKNINRLKMLTSMMMSWLIKAFFWL